MLSRRGVGTAVFGGMIAASAFGIFMIPVLYVIFQRVREVGKRRKKAAPDGQSDPSRGRRNGAL